MANYRRAALLLVTTLCVVAASELPPAAHDLRCKLRSPSLFCIFCLMEGKRLSCPSCESADETDSKYSVSPGFATQGVCLSVRFNRLFSLSKTRLLFSLLSLSLSLTLSLSLCFSLSLSLSLFGGGVSSLSSQLSQILYSDRSLFLHAYKDTKTILPQDKKECPNNQLFTNSDCKRDRS